MFFFHFKCGIPSYFYLICVEPKLNKKIIMRKLFLFAALLIASSFAASAQCDWRDFKGVKLYVKYYGEANVKVEPVDFDGRPRECRDDEEYFYFDGNRKLYWNHEDHEDVYYVEYDHRRDEYTTFDVTDYDGHDRHNNSFFQIVQCEKRGIIIWSSDGIARYCEPSSYVDYEYKDYHHHHHDYDDYDRDRHHHDYDHDHHHHDHDCDHHHHDHDHDHHHHHDHDDEGGLLDAILDVL